jgi:uncharacterized protein YbjT (DUF2867 family)
MKIFVAGGNGFIGREVCRAAVEAGHEVVALARSGAPRGAAAWMDAVTWVVADVLDPGAWRARLEGCGAVIHCVGIIAENAAHDATFERINGDAAIVAAREAARAGVEAFVFLSASAKPPLIPSGYITAKRRAEEAILAMVPRPVVFRPGFVYGTGRLVSYAAAFGIRIGMLVPGVGRKARESRPLAVAVVARAAVRAAGDAGVRGIVDVDGIERLGGG